MRLLRSFETKLHILLPLLGRGCTRVEYEWLSKINYCLGLRSACRIGLERSLHVGGEDSNDC
jgi:hypothetical protein